MNISLLFKSLPQSNCGKTTETQNNNITILCKKLTVIMAIYTHHMLKQVERARMYKNVRNHLLFCVSLSDAEQLSQPIQEQIQHLLKQMVCHRTGTLSQMERITYVCH